MFQALFKRRIFIIVITVLFGITSATYCFLAQYNKLTMTISLNYPNAESGLNPDGTRFNVFEIKSDEVLDGALSVFNASGITVDELRDRIDIYAKSSNKTAERVKTANIAGKNFKYIPNEYSISYSQKAKLSKNYTTEILKAIAQSYKTVFERRHTDKVNVLEFEKSDFDDYKHYEYVELADILTDRLEAMERFISHLKEENGAYRSDETEQTFANILVMVSNLKNIEVEKYRAFVISSALAKDRNAYIQKLDYAIDSLSLDKDKSIRETSFIRGAIEKYDPNITGVAFIPSLDSNNEFYMNRTKTGLDYLTASAYEAGINTETIAKEMDKNIYLKNVFSKPSTSGGENARLMQAAEKMIANIEQKLFQIEDISLTTVNEYMLYKTRDYVKFTIPPNTIINNVLVKSTLFYSLIGFLLSCSWVLLKQRLLQKRGVK